MKKKNSEMIGFFLQIMNCMKYRRGSDPKQVCVTKKKSVAVVWVKKYEYHHDIISLKTKDYKIGICCFSAKHTALRRQGKD